MSGWAWAAVGALAYLILAPIGAVAVGRYLARRDQEGPHR